MKKELPHAVFVYGTLMRGQRANHMMAEGVYAGEYTLPGYAMYDLGRYPGIVPRKGCQVEGEVYFVSETMLTAMDDYEEEGSLYHRREVTVQSEKGERAAWAYIYAREVSGSPVTCRWGGKD